MIDCTLRIIVSDNFEIPVNTLKDLENMIVNLGDCQNEDGQFKINGTYCFWVETIVPCTVERDGDFRTIYYDGLYRLTAYGGYELGGRGCFYEKIVA